MALYATNRFPGDGSTTSYEFNFAGKYLDRRHVKAYQEDNETKARTYIPLTDSNFLNDTTLRNLPVTPIGKTLGIYRETPRIPLVDFINGSRLTEVNLDTATRQGAFIAIECADALAPDALADTFKLLERFSSTTAEARDQAVSSVRQAANSAGAAAGSANIASTAVANVQESVRLAGIATVNARASADVAARSAGAAETRAVEAVTAADTAALALAQLNALLGIGIGTSYVNADGDLIMTYVPPVTSVYIDADGNLSLDY